MFEVSQANYHRARNYQNTTRAYDAQHPAELVEHPSHKWKLYTREIYLRRQNFVKILNAACENLSLVRKLRAELSTDCSLGAQKTLFEQFQKLQVNFTVGLTMLGCDLDEAVGDAQLGLEEIINKSSIPVDAERKAHERRENANVRRFHRLTAMEIFVETETTKFHREVARELVALKSEMPNFDELSPKLVPISEPAW